jgi:rhamnose utilization protein RhaD (predicted bifunctional aldolase and dehydrogenase)/NAD(P)-dependent dehydrogenase (short-subunit alcohol dehydrogenase family)
MATALAPIPSAPIAPPPAVLAAPSPAGADCAPADPLLARCVEVSRRLGARTDLALHGGGNTSVKSSLPDLAGEPVEALWVKSSGRDLAGIDASGFSPVRLGSLRRLLTLETLSDTAMAYELRRALLDPSAPAPSVETLAHAALPHRFVLHAHPDAVLAVTSSPGGARRARAIFGPAFLVLPWAMPGFALGRAVDELWHRSGRPRTRGIVLLHHGVLTFSEDADEAWEALVECDSRARRALETLPRRPALPAPPERPPWTHLDIASLRLELSRLAGRPLLLALDDSAGARRFADHPGVAELVRRGPLTPDHVLRTKRTAIVLPSAERARPALARYAQDYRDYFRRGAAGRELAMLDPAPRVVVAPGTGIFAAGASDAGALAALELYRHTADTLLAAEPLGGHRPLPAREVFEVEYWELEQAKLDPALRGGTDRQRHGRGAAAQPLAGRVALITGAASGIGRATVEELLAAGAVVAGLDLTPTCSRAGYLGLTCDVREPAALERALGSAVRRFGGLDLLVSNVGVFPPSRSIEELTLAEWRAVMEVNATSHLALLGAAIPLLQRAAAPPAVVLVGSRNVLAPGPGAAAYSASKAALTQLARVAALELAPFGIRVNVLHPDGVFDTALWQPEVLSERAARYGLSVEQYRRRNLLRTEVHAADVARLAVALCTDLFACTTGAQIPVDGGDARVI